MEKLLFILLLLAITSCDKKNKHVIEYFPNKNIKAEYFTTADKKIEGVCKDYFESGKIRMVTKYKKGMLDGKSFTYYENGKLKSEASFTMNKPNGWFIDYDSTETIYRKAKSVLVYNNMFYAAPHKFIENDTVNITEKEDYINSCYYYENNELLRDSSYYCTIEFDNANERIILGDSLHITIAVPYNFFIHNNFLKFMFRVEDSNNNKVISNDTFEKPLNIPTMGKYSIKPLKKGVGYIYGVIKEINSENEEAHDFYFKKKYVVE